MNCKDCKFYNKQHNVCILFETKLIKDGEVDQCNGKQLKEKQ